MENLNSIIETVTESEIKETAGQVEKMSAVAGRDPLNMIAYA